MAKASSIRQNTYNQRQRARAIEAMGGQCARCGIRYPLDIDHVNDDGFHYRGRVYNQPSMTGAARARILKAIIDGNTTDYQLLCPNCNRLKAVDRDLYDAPPTYGPMGD